MGTPCAISICMPLDACMTHIHTNTSHHTNSHAKCTQEHKHAHKQVWLCMYSSLHVPACMYAYAYVCTLLTATLMSVALSVPGALPGGVRHMVTGESCCTNLNSDQKGWCWEKGPARGVKSGMPLRILTSCLQTKTHTHTHTHTHAHAHIYTHTQADIGNQVHVCRQDLGSPCHACESSCMPSTCMASCMA